MGRETHKEDSWKLCSFCFIVSNNKEIGTRALDPSLFTNYPPFPPIEYDEEKVERAAKPACVFFRGVSLWYLMHAV